MKLQNRIVRVILLCLVTLIIAGCGGAEQRKAQYLERGKEYFKQEKYDKALVELRNVLQIDPKYAEAYYLIGQVEEKKQNWERAFGNYFQAVELNPSYSEARYKLGLLYYMSGNIDKASEMADGILKVQKNNPYGRTLHAAIMNKKGDKNGAIRETEKVLEEDPSLDEAVNSLAAIYNAMGNQDKAIEVLGKGIVANSKNIPLRLELVGLLTEKKDFRRAEEVLQEIVSLQPDKLGYRMMLASFYARLNQNDKAEKMLRDAIQIDPDDGERYFMLADFLVRQDKIDRAEEELLAATKARPKNYKIRLGLARLYESIGDANKAVQGYRETIDAAGTDPIGLTARNRLASILAYQGNLNGAGKLVEEVLKENPGDNEALLIKGKLALAKQDTQGAITAFQTVLRDQPNLVEAFLSLAEAHRMRNEPELAKENLQKAIELNPKSITAHLALAKYFALRGDSDAAAKRIDQALEISPNDMDSLQAKADYLQSKNNMKELQVTLEKMKTAHPDNPQGYYHLGELYLSQKKYDNAIREFELAMARSRDIALPLVAIVKANLEQGKPEKAVVRLNDILKKEPNQFFTHNLLGEVYIRLKKSNEAEQSFRKAIEANPKWNVPYINLARLSFLKGDLAAAVQACQQGLNAIPDDQQLLMSRGELHGKMHDYDKAIATYERILSIYAADDAAANNLATLLTEHKSDTQSLKRAKEVAIRFESSLEPAFMDTLGWVYYKTGEHDKAIALLEKAVKQQPEPPIFHYHLGMTYYKKGNLPSAKSHLSKAVESKDEYMGLDEARATFKQIQ